MADIKEALPVVAWRTDDHGTSSVALEREDLGLIGQRYGYPLTDHATATAAIAELRAEVERLKADAERLQGELLAQRSKLRLAEARVNAMLGRQYVTRQRD